MKRRVCTSASQQQQQGQARPAVAAALSAIWEQGILARQLESEPLRERPYLNLVVCWECVYQRAPLGPVTACRVDGSILQAPFPEGLPCK